MCQMQLIPITNSRASLKSDGLDPEELTFLRIALGVLQWVPSRRRTFRCATPARTWAISSKPTK